LGPISEVIPAVRYWSLQRPTASLWWGFVAFEVCALHIQAAAFPLTAQGEIVEVADGGAVNRTGIGFRIEEGPRPISGVRGRDTELAPLHFPMGIVLDYTRSDKVKNLVAVAVLTSSSPKFSV
jgi:hypothetical protein